MHKEGVHGRAHEGLAGGHRGAAVQHRGAEGGVPGRVERGVQVDLRGRRRRLGVSRILRAPQNAYTNKAKSGHISLQRGGPYIGFP